MTLCICGHDDELHDAYAGKCVKCDCDIYRVDVFALEAQLAALTAERDTEREAVAHAIATFTQERNELRDALKDLLGWANIQDHHSAQAISIRGRAWAALQNEETK